jgi:outer membrane protein OmpA-like peptidoglycan-associated protein/tetratricopeptide (TPR) repeat protein
MKKSYILIIAILLSLTATAKTKKADRLFERWEYFRAAKLYKKEAAKHPSSDLYFKLGECYRKMNLYKEEQAAYDKVDSAGTYSNPEFYLNYGQVLKNNGRYDKAKIAFDKYTELMPSDPRGKFFSTSIDIVTEDHKTDEPVTISNVGTLNTPMADLSPVFYKDGIVFTSSRKTPGHEKIYTWTGADYFDVYYAKKGNNDTDYSNVGPFGKDDINKKFHNGLACFSKNCDTIYVSRVEKYLKATDKKLLNIERNKIFMSTMKDDKWSKSLPFTLNSNNYSVANPFLTPDGSRIYFVSDMPGGLGETDIYYCNREGAGWSAPINMGPNVNTFNREKFPNMDAKGNFYFSSDGYQGFGGADICVALNKNGTLEKAIPMKYPFNSFTDDLSIVFLKNEKTGYITSNRYEDGKGDDDIFYFTLLNDKTDSTLVASIYTIGYKPKVVEIVVAITTTLKGTVTDKATKLPLGANIHILDNTLHEPFITLNADSVTGAYSTTLIPGKNYGLIVKMKGYLFHSENFTVPITNMTQEITKDIELQKIEVGAKIVLKNVFFDYNKATLKPESAFELDHVVKILNEYPTMKIELSGHTDNRGTDIFNIKLSQARAKACVNYLLSKGIKTDRLTSKGFGESKPIDTNETEEGMANNRRTEFKITHK